MEVKSILDSRAVLWQTKPPWHDWLVAASLEALNLLPCVYQNYVSKHRLSSRALILILDKV